jgi:hypothetical protein
VAIGRQAATRASSASIDHHHEHASRDHNGSDGCGSEHGDKTAAQQTTHNRTCPPCIGNTTRKSGAKQQRSDAEINRFRYFTRMAESHISFSVSNHVSAWPHEQQSSELFRPAALFFVAPCRICARAIPPRSSITPKTCG